MTTDEYTTSGSWDAEYQRGRYHAEPPVAMTDDIIREARAREIDSGLYIGCGNGRNYVPLRAAGLDLTGLDVSAVALDQLRRRLANLPTDRLVQGTVNHLPCQAQFPLVIGIQVFQHGRRAQCHAHVTAATDRVAPGGLFCVRVNAVGTDLYPAHDIVECNEDDGLTIRYTAGPKAGLDIHFFTRAELEQVVPANFVPVHELRQVTEHRQPPAPGKWSQWEGMWVRPPDKHLIPAPST